MSSRKLKWVALMMVLMLMTFSVALVQAEEIKVVGTGSGAPVLEALAAAFSQKNPGVTVSVPPSTGSGGAIKAVGTGQEAIARVARDLKDSEKEYGLKRSPYAKVAIVFFVNKSVGVQSLSPQQICNIYSGKITNWQEVGGKDAKIRVVRREDGDSSLDALLESLPGFKSITITDKSKTTYSDPETSELVQNTVDSIAFGTYANARATDVDIIKIDGKGPKDQGYPPCFSTLAFVFKEGNLSENMKKLVEFTTSADARAVIESGGGVPL